MSNTRVGKFVDGMFIDCFLYFGVKIPVFKTDVYDVNSKYALQPTVPEFKGIKTQDRGCWRLELNEKQQTDDVRTFSGWTRQVDRGGLSYPSADFVSFLSSCEAAIPDKLPNGPQSFSFDHTIADDISDHSFMFWWDKLYHK